MTDAIDNYRIPSHKLSLLEDELTWASRIFEQIQFLNKEFLLLRIRASWRRLSWNQKTDMHNTSITRKIGIILLHLTQATDCWPNRYSEQEGDGRRSK